MSYILFLDDRRNPTEDLQNVKVARTPFQAAGLIEEHGVPDVISFDYHLNMRSQTGETFMRYIIRHHLDNKIDANKIKNIIIHSADPDGCILLKRTWDDFSKLQLSSNVQAVINTRYD